MRNVLDPGCQALKLLFMWGEYLLRLGVQVESTCRMHAFLEIIKSFKRFADLITKIGVKHTEFSHFIHKMPVDYLCIYKCACKLKVKMN